MATPRVTLLGKPGCHLCDDARAVILSVLQETAWGPSALVERSILDDPVLYEQYVEDIPVVLIDDRVHTYWRVDADRLRHALARRP